MQCSLANKFINNRRGVQALTEFSTSSPVVARSHSCADNIKDVADQILDYLTKGPHIDFEMMILVYLSADKIEIGIIAKIMSTGFDRGVLI